MFSDILLKLEKCITFVIDNSKYKIFKNDKKAQITRKRNRNKKVE